MSLTPHGPGFRFLDAIEILAPGERGVGRLWLDPRRAFFAGHFPGQPLMPGVLLIEFAAQAAGAVWAKPQARLAGVHQFRFQRPVLPGQTLTAEITLEKDLGPLAQFAAVLRVDNEIVAQGKLSLSQSA